MITLLEVQTLLDHIFNENTLPMHEKFWKTNSNTELLNTRFFDIPLFSAINGEQSNLIVALNRIMKKEEINGDNLNLATYVDSNYSITDRDITLLENWVSQFNLVQKSEPLLLQNSESDNQKTEQTQSIYETHIQYWRDIDIFFLPNLASDETKPHVRKMHFNALQNWIPSNLVNQNPTLWTDFLSNPETLKSFEYIRLHQRRIINQYYGESQELVFDSLWRFGGDLLPIDPLSQALPKHRMNGVFDWMVWIPYLDASLRSGDLNEFDLNLAKGWQIGIVADGLLRTDSERPSESRMPINDFSGDDLNLKENVINEFKNYDAQTLLSKMISRAKEALAAGGIFPF